MLCSDVSKLFMRHSHQKLSQVHSAVLDAVTYLKLLRVAALLHHEDVRGRAALLLVTHAEAEDIGELLLQVGECGEVAGLLRIADRRTQRLDVFQEHRLQVLGRVRLHGMSRGVVEELTGSSLRESVVPHQRPDHEVARRATRDKLENKVRPLLQLLVVRAVSTSANAVDLLLRHHPLGL